MSKVNLNKSICIYIYQNDGERKTATPSPPTDEDKEMVFCGPMTIVRVSIVDGNLVAHEMDRNKEWKPVSDFEYSIDLDTGSKLHSEPYSHIHGPDALIHEDHTN